MGFIVIVILVVPALMGHGPAPKRPFDESPILMLQKSRPELVFMGDSMLGTRIDPAVLRKETSARCEVLAINGSGSALWFLAMKNYIAVQQERPKWVIVFYRANQLTLPDFRAEGRYRSRLETFQHEAEPLFTQILAAASRDRHGWLDRLSLGIYPVQRFREKAQGALEHLALHLVTRRDRSAGVRKATEELFDLNNLRAGGAGPEEGEEADLQQSDQTSADDFARTAARSFLPPFLQIAREGNMRLLFFRVKSRPSPEGEFAAESSGEKQYQRELKTYVEHAGAVLVDESRDPEVTFSFYGAGEHVAPEMMGRYTGLFWRKVGPVLGEAEAPAR